MTIHDALQIAHITLLHFYHVNTSVIRQCHNDRNGAALAPQYCIRIVLHKDGSGRSIPQPYYISGTYQYQI